MTLLGSRQVQGQIVQMATTDPRHYRSDGAMDAGTVDRRRSFGELMAQAVGQLTDVQQQPSDIFERMLTHPDQVEPHDISIAISKAEMSLRLTKTIVDRAVKAYNDMTAMR